MRPEEIISNDANLDFKFFFCPTYKKRVRAGKCSGCDKFPCDIIFNLIAGKEKDYLKLTRIRRCTDMKEYVIQAENKTEVVNENQLQKKSIPDGAVVYEVRKKYRVENKLVKKDVKQNSFFAHRESDGTIDNLNNINYKSGDIINELGAKSMVKKVLVRIDKPKRRKRTTRKTTRKKAADSKKTQ